MYLKGVPRKRRTKIYKMGQNYALDFPYHIFDRIEHVFGGNIEWTINF